MKRFGTEGRVYPSTHSVVSRTEEIADFIERIKQGRYIVLFAPQQTGKTTFFRWAIEALTTQDSTYFPIQLNFEEYEEYTAVDFYASLSIEIRKEIERVFQKREAAPSDALVQFLADTEITEHVSMREFFEEFAQHLTHHNYQRLILIIDEFDGIPSTAIKGFLGSLRHIYLSAEVRCPHSVGIVGIKSITQLSEEKSISPFNIQDEFNLPNFSLKQVQELIGQYTTEVGQGFASEVIAEIHKQTGGQPVLVNRLTQILTEELDIPKAEPITMSHLSVAHAQLLRGRNTNIQHLTTNIRKDPRFENVLMKIMTRDEGIEFNLDNDIINELFMYGVIKEGTDGIVKHIIIWTFCSTYFQFVPMPFCSTYFQFVPMPFCSTYFQFVMSN